MVYIALIYQNYFCRIASVYFTSNKFSRNRFNALGCTTV